MAIDWAATFLFGASLLCAVGVGEALRRLAGWTAEASRRVVHALVGMTVAATPLGFARPEGIALVAAAFVVGNAVALRRSWFPGMHGIRRQSLGTVLFPAALLPALGLGWVLDADRVFTITAAFLVLGISDPLASWVGTTRSALHRLDGTHKTVEGSAAFFISAAVLITAVVVGNGALSNWGALYVVAAVLCGASAATVAEVLGRGGWDNLFIVLAVVIVLGALEIEPAHAGVFLGALFAALAFGAGTVRAGFLTLSGALAASLPAWALVALGGWAWAVPGFAYFFASSLLSRFGRHRKREAQRLAEKSGPRDAVQVAANGGAALLMLVAFVFGGGAVCYWGFVGAFASSAADTWATEIGTWARGRTRRLLVGCRVPSGSSGGMSVAGTLGAVLGATVVFGAAWPVAGGLRLGMTLPEAALLVIGSGVLGSLVDSFLGATAQARFRLPDGSLTERAFSSGRTLVHAAGRPGLTNDLVNVACTVTGAVVGVVTACVMAS